MADLDKFQRSRKMIMEMQNALTTTDNDTDTDAIKSYINTLEKSITIIDNKIEEYKVKDAAVALNDVLSENSKPDDCLAA